MRILILAPTLEGGGAERVASLWANGFVEEGHEVAVATIGKQTKVMQYPINSKVKLYDLNYGSLVRFIFYRIQSFAILLYYFVIRLFKPDLIIGVMPPYAYLAKKALCGLKIPVINTEHNSFERPSYAPLSKQDYKQKFERNKLFDQVTVLTQADKDFIGDRLTNVSVLPNPLSFISVNQLPEKKKSILAAGRFDDWHCKGFDVLLEAWARIACQYEDWELQIAGTGSKQNIIFIEGLIEKYNIKNRVKLLGFCTNLQDLYKESSIFVLSSRYEGFGMVLIEAMSQGCACIACDYKGRQAEIITSSEEGIICPVDNVDALSRSIDKMISDDVYRKQVQLNAIKRSRFYDLKHTMKRWDCIIQKVING